MYPKLNLNEIINISVAGYKGNFHCMGSLNGSVMDITFLLSLTFILNPLRIKFFRGNINIYLHFVSFLHIDATQVVEILPQIRQEPTYST